MTRIVKLGTKRSGANVIARLSRAALESPALVTRSAPDLSSKPPKARSLGAVRRSRPGSASENPAGNSGCLPGPAQSAFRFNRGGSTGSQHCSGEVSESFCSLTAPVHIN